MEPTRQPRETAKHACLLFTIVTAFIVPLSVYLPSASAYADVATADETYRQVRELGETRGYEAGYRAGHAQGRAASKDRVYQTAYDRGYGFGFEQGRVEGRRKGIEEGAREWEREGYRKGRARGAVEGHDQAFLIFVDKEYPADYESGFQEGFNTGAQKGHQEGYDAGYKETYDRTYRDFASRDYPDETSRGFQIGKTEGKGRGFQEAGEKKRQEGYRQGYEEMREKIFPQAYDRGYLLGEAQAQAHYDSSAILQLESVHLIDAPADGVFEAGEDLGLVVDLVNYGGVTSPPVALTAEASEAGVIVFRNQPVSIGAIPARSRSRKELVLGTIDLDAGTNIPVSLDCRFAAAADPLGSQDLQIVSFNPETRRYQYLLAAEEDLRQALALSELPQAETARINGILTKLAGLRAVERLDTSDHLLNEAAALGRELDALVAAQLTEVPFVEILPLLAVASMRLQYLLDVAPVALPTVAQQGDSGPPVLADQEPRSYSLCAKGQVRSGDEQRKFKYRLHFTRRLLIADVAAVGGFGLRDVHAALVANCVDEVKGLSSSPAVIYQMFTSGGEPFLPTRQMAHVDVEYTFPILPASLLSLPSAADGLQEKQHWDVPLSLAYYPLHVLRAIHFAVKKTKKHPHGSIVEICGEVLDQQERGAGSCSFALQLPSCVLRREEFAIHLREPQARWEGEIELLSAD